MQKNFVLHDYQELAKNFLMTRPKAGLFLDVGFGKTLVTLAALQELAENGQLSGHILVVAPKTIAKSTWLKEMKKWNIQANTVSLIVNEKGKQLTRKKRLELYEGIYTHPAAFYFINQELLTDLIMWVKNSRRPWPFPNVVIDELHSFKSYASNRFKAIRSLYDQIYRFIGLTGTPMPQSMEDLWAEVALIDDGARLGPNITSYRNTYFYPGFVVNGRQVDWRPKEGAEEYIFNRIRDVVMSIKNPDLKLPDVVYSDFPVYMTQEEKEVYKSFVKEKLLEVRDDEGNVIPIEAQNSAVMTAKLSQLASGTVYTGNGKEYAVLHQHKLEALEYIIANTGSPVLVAYYFNSDLAQISKYFGEKGIPFEVLDGSIEMQDRWNAGQIPVMLMQPGSMGRGINIQDGGCTLVWYTVTWSLEQYQQTIGRLHRQGQKNTVAVIHLLTEDTIDYRILDRIEKKDTSQKALMEAVSATVGDALEDR